MPIRPENRARYPADWPSISARVRAEAGQRCEWCEVPHGALIRRGVNGDGIHVWKLAASGVHENGMAADDGREVPDSDDDLTDYRHPVRVILTVAHLDHQPENCARANLRALCQSCHNRYDAPMRAAGRRDRARKACAAGDLFDPTNQEG